MKIGDKLEGKSSGYAVDGLDIVEEAYGTEKELKPCPFCGAEAVIDTIEPHSHMLVFLPDYGGRDIYRMHWLHLCNSRRDRT